MFLIKMSKNYIIEKKALTVKSHMKIYKYIGVLTKLLLDK